MWHRESAASFLPTHPRRIFSMQVCACAIDCARIVVMYPMIATHVSYSIGTKGISILCWHTTCQVVFFLTACNSDTHCLSVVNESLEAKKASLFS